MRFFIFQARRIIQEAKRRVMPFGRKTETLPSFVFRPPVPQSAT
jgi:hypothetical protein